MKDRKKLLKTLDITSITMYILHSDNCKGE